VNPNTPKVIQRSDPKRVAIEWADGVRLSLTAAELRRLCPCAHCVSELTGVRTLDPASVPEDLTQTELGLVGNYAITMWFSDGHHTGIYGFAMLRDLATRAAADRAGEG
jgi:DUF971 family protein